jgi:hypothetical protein
MYLVTGAAFLVGGAGGAGAVTAASFGRVLGSADAGIRYMLRSWACDQIALGVFLGYGAAQESQVYVGRAATVLPLINLYRWIPAAIAGTHPVLSQDALRSMIAADLILVTLLLYHVAPHFRAAVDKFGLLVRGVSESSEEEADGPGSPLANRTRSKSPGRKASPAKATTASPAATRKLPTRVSRGRSPARLRSRGNTPTK